MLIILANIVIEDIITLEAALEGFKQTNSNSNANVAVSYSYVGIWLLV